MIRFSKQIRNPNGSRICDIICEDEAWMVRIKKDGILTTIRMRGWSYTIENTHKGEPVKHYTDFYPRDK